MPRRKFQVSHYSNINPNPAKPQLLLSPKYAESVKNWTEGEFHFHTVEMYQCLKYREINYIVLYGNKDPDHAMAVVWTYSTNAPSSGVLGQTLDFIS